MIHDTPSAHGLWTLVILNPAVFIIILLGFLPRWPAFLTLLMVPFLVVMYVRLARAKEEAVRREFGAAHEHHASVTPGWFPRPGGPASAVRSARDMTRDMTGDMK